MGRRLLLLVVFLCTDRCDAFTRCVTSKNHRMPTPSTTAAPNVAALARPRSRTVPSRAPRGHTKGGASEPNRRTLLTAGILSLADDFIAAGFAARAGGAARTGGTASLETAQGAAGGAGLLLVTTVEEALAQQLDELEAHNAKGSPAANMPTAKVLGDPRKPQGASEITVQVRAPTTAGGNRVRLMWLKGTNGQLCGMKRFEEQDGLPSMQVTVQSGTKVTPMLLSDTDGVWEGRSIIASQSPLVRWFQERSRVERNAF
jgi:hypothetical protein